MKSRSAPCSNTKPRRSGPPWRGEAAVRPGNARPAAKPPPGAFRGYAGGEGMVGKGQWRVARSGRAGGIRGPHNDRPEHAAPTEYGEQANRHHRPAFTSLQLHLRGLAADRYPSLNSRSSTILLRDPQPACAMVMPSQHCPHVIFRPILSPKGPPTPICPECSPLLKVANLLPLSRSQ